MLIMMTNVKYEYQIDGKLIKGYEVKCADNKLFKNQLLGSNHTIKIQL